MHMSERAYTAQAGITGKPDAAWICWEMALQAELHLSNTPHRFQVVSLPSILHPILILRLPDLILQHCQHPARSWNSLLH